MIWHVKIDADQVDLHMNSVYSQQTRFECVVTGISNLANFLTHKDLNCSTCLITKHRYLGILSSNVFLPIHQLIIGQHHHSSLVVSTNGTERDRAPFCCLNVKPNTKEFVSSLRAGPRQQEFEFWSIYTVEHVGRKSL